FCRRFQFAFGPSCLNGFWRIEAGKMLANYLFSRVALNAFRSGIPSSDIALRIEHENRIVLYALNQQSKSFLAFAQSLFTFPAVGDVPKYQDNADDYARVITNGRGTIINSSFRTVFSDEQSMVCQTNNHTFAQGTRSRILYVVTGLLINNSENHVESNACSVILIPAG